MEFKKKLAIPKNEVPENSSMARNMKEIKELGQQMDEMLTNKELKKQGLVADPQQ
ncbi:hypothetical protein IEO70_02095 [Bacillus sp. AGMB 02131]|uniref:Multidrug ABC transporter ATPase n=1 Tax=Peribacillus faecalis TaxID=2772559 RepID=A0A927CXK1_9BACI|nr:hypothetical protein [Peribacillus faecalis]MBD3107159.1 hypothetical protein [Peribacillus faecalis]